jgi:hypothetical protein
MNPIKLFRNWWLARLLRRAAAEMRQQGDQTIPYTDFRTRLEFAEFLNAAAKRVRGGDTSDCHRLSELFTPTGDWDNAGGSQNTGNLLCSALGIICRHMA